MPFFDSVPGSFVPRQKFCRGDLVILNRPGRKFHGTRAIVVGSASDIHGYPHGDEPSYTLLLEEGGIYPDTPLVRAWFKESELRSCGDELPYNGLTDPLELHELTERILQYYNETRFKTN